MGRRLNVSTPTVINTELVPLDESFYLEVDGQMEQWYYDNTEQYAPNRKVTPLLLTPVISAFDKDTDTSYTPAFNTTQWFAKEWNESQGKYVETAITNQVDSASADYVIQGNNLLVKKNVSYSHAVSIRCVATYIDARDSGVTYTVEDNVNLTTNRTADVVFPEVDIISASGRSYNPLVDDENSEYEFKGITTNNPVQPLNTDVRRYPVDVDGTEEILNSGEAVAPIMDVRYGENVMTDQEFMYRQTAGGELVGGSIDKAYIERIKGNTIAWNQIGKFNTSNVSVSGLNGIDVNHSQNTFLCTVGSNKSNAYLGFGSITAVSSRIVDSWNTSHNYYISFRIASENITANKVFVGGASTTAEVDYSPTKQVYGFIYKPDGVQLWLGFNGDATSGQTFSIDDKINVIDLTLTYGAGNEPTTVEQFEADYERWFGKPLPYEEYDEGSLRPVLMQSVKTTGFNQWDEEWENGAISSNTGEDALSNSDIRSKNYISVIPNTSFYCKCPQISLNVRYYDANKIFLQTLNGMVKNMFTVPDKACYMRFWGSGTTYNHDICINISNPSKNGTYEPYEEKLQGFDVTAIKGKLDGAGESVTIFPDGLKKAGNVQDEIFVEDGVVKAIKRVGSVDLGTLDWNAVTLLGRIWMATSSISDIVNLTSGYSANCLCDRYLSDLSGESTDKYCRIGQNKTFYILDSSYSDAATFKTAMQGVMLYYELATPETYVLDPITDFVWYGIKNGQEVLADTFPWYVSGQGTDNLTVDAMYGENINVVLRCKMMDGETLSPSKAYATLNWRTPDIETFVQSDKGGAVRGDTDEMTFDTIVNVNGDVLSDAIKQKHLAFNWKIRKNNTSTEIDKGWGQRITIDASELRNVKQTPSSTLASTLVSNEVYLKGAYEEVTEDGEVVTYNGEAVYDRPID